MGDLRRQQTPRLRAQSATLYTELDYDRLARLTARRDPSNDLLQTVTSTFTYDQVAPAGCEAGKGHLTSEAISGGGEPGLTTTYCYSPAQFGRLANEQRTTGGVTYQTDFTYDVLGRVSQVKYPATTSYSGASRYTVTYSYNPRGHLERVANGATVLYQTVGANARGQIEKAYLGDGSRTTRNYLKGTERLTFTNAAIGAAQPVQNFIYTYDASGNVSARADLINSVSEAFGYDSLDRLTNATVTNGTGAHPVAYQYDDAAGNLGNLTHKSDISTLASASMAYSGTGRPHALQTLNTGSATRTFTYNANGSMTGGQVDSGTRTIGWTSYELPASITIGTISRTFSYGADRQRYRQVSVSGGTTRTYTYAGEHYVKEVEGASTEHKLYLYANGERVGYVADDGTPETRYFHKDHLGSITTIITNQNWAGREKLSYDAWGKRRHGTDWWSAAAAASEERGYTGHEHLDNVSLIHMNGRLLDPKLGRVISADPFVPAPLFSQSYNRYAYVYNNPLKYTDPSGFSPRDPDYDRPPRERDRCERVNTLCSPFFPAFTGIPDDGFDWAEGWAWAYYLQQQEQEQAQHAAVQLANSWRVDHPAAKTDQEGLKPLVPQGGNNEAIGLGPIGSSADNSSPVLVAGIAIAGAEAWDKTGRFIAGRAAGGFSAGMFAMGEDLGMVNPLKDTIASVAKSTGLPDSEGFVRAVDGGLQVASGTGGIFAAAAMAGASGASVLVAVPVVTFTSSYAITSGVDALTGGAITGAVTDTIEAVATYSSLRYRVVYGDLRPR
jgi:RHS repeat-associated protein